MKIRNLLENLTPTSFADKRYNGKFGAASGRTGVLGDGSFSRAREDKKNPHSVVKHSKLPLRFQEGFNLFATYVATTPGAMDNVHIPKVYKISKYTDKNGKHIDVYDVEKLIDGGSITEKEFKYMLESYFDTSDSKLARIIERNGYTEYVLAEVIEFSVLSDEYAKKIISTELQKAVVIVRNAVEYANNNLDTFSVSARTDLHNENIMYRRTPFGVQCVISDPIVVM